MVTSLVTCLVTTQVRAKPGETGVCDHVTTLFFHLVGYDKEWDKMYVDVGKKRTILPRVLSRACARACAHRARTRVREARSSVVVLCCPLPHPSLDTPGTPWQKSHRTTRTRRGCRPDGRWACAAPRSAWAPGATDWPGLHPRRVRALPQASVGGARGAAGASSSRDHRLVVPA